MKLYVGNLPYSMNETSLRSLFESYGSVESASIISDRDTGSSKGFGFVEMSNADAQKAMSALDGFQLEGRSLKVNEARPKEPRIGGGGGGGGSRGGFGGGGGGGRGGFGGGGGGGRKRF
jgi:cold-inducible RNA-binding protein